MLKVFWGLYFPPSVSVSRLSTCRILRYGVASGLNGETYEPDRLL